jgi:hypothetical protein
VAERSNILLIGGGRLARHLERYFEQLRLPYLQWSRRLELEERCPRLEALVHSDTHALLAISDAAIEPFIRSHPELSKTVRIHLTSLIPGIPNPCFFIEPEWRERYHALCVLAGNFTTLLWRKFFFEIEKELGMPREQALPYLESITRGLSGTGPPLSGPLSRGDQTTLHRNLEALKGDPFEQVYRAFVSAYERQGKLAMAAGGKDWLIP